jgi:hypothetical protein
MHFRGSWVGVELGAVSLLLEQLTHPSSEIKAIPLAILIMSSATTVRVGE